MDGIIAILLVLAGGTCLGLLILWLVRWRISVTKKVTEKWIAENNIDAEILKVGMPPLRLWLRNRKGDSWAQLRFSDGTEQWLRIRGRLFSDDSYDLFD